MELHKAIKDIVASKGADMICNPQIINYLLDYQAFKEKPATKLILKSIIDMGYAERILALNSNSADKNTKLIQYQHEFVESYGFKENITRYVFGCIFFALGMIDNPDSTLSFSLSDNEKISLPKESHIIKEDHDNLPNSDSSVRVYSAVMKITRAVAGLLDKREWFYYDIENSIYKAHEALPQLQEMGIVSKKWINGKGYKILINDKDEIDFIINTFYGNQVQAKEVHNYKFNHVLPDTERIALRFVGSNFFTEKDVLNYLDNVKEVKDVCEQLLEMRIIDKKVRLTKDLNGKINIIKGFKALYNNDDRIRRIISLFYF